MQRHDLDPLALVFGAIFTIFGLAYAIGRWNWFDFGGSWALAVGLIALGFAGVVSATRRGRAGEPESRPDSPGPTARS